MAEFLTKYWDRIVDFFDMVYIAIRDYLLAAEAKKDAE
jgi:hypothetical protein